MVDDILVVYDHYNGRNYSTYYATRPPLLPEALWLVVVAHL